MFGFFVTYAGLDASVTHVLRARVAMAPAVQVRDDELAVGMSFCEMALVIAEALVTQLGRCFT